mgnify:CR=1 FL=1
MNKLKVLAKLAVIYCVIASPCDAMTFDRDYLYNFIENYVKNHTPVSKQGRLNIEVSAIDSRITLQPCVTPLVAEIPNLYKSRNINVKVACLDENPWQLFVPVRIQTIIPVLVTKMRIAKGTILDTLNTEVVYKDNTQIRGTVLSHAKNITGARTKRNLSQGSAITHQNTCFVCKGQAVNIIAKSPAFEIKSSGIALKGGSLGEIIPVKNKKSGRIVQGQVNAINQVVINL